MTRREQMKAAVAGALAAKAVADKAAAKEAAKPAVASDAKPAVPKKPKVERSAKARDARAADRGRLPSGSKFETEYDGDKKEWSGKLLVFTEEMFGTPVYMTFHHKAEGVFRLLEELDVMYWEWVQAFSKPPAGEPAGKGGA